jgi:hypothetical protein
MVTSNPSSLIGNTIEQRRNRCLGLNLDRRIGPVLLYRTGRRRMPRKWQIQLTSLYR